MPIVLVSGFIGPIMTERALAAGVNEILKKPVRSRDVAAVLARLLKPRLATQELMRIGEAPEALFTPAASAALD